MTEKPKGKLAFSKTQKQTEHHVVLCLDCGVMLMFERQMEPSDPLPSSRLFPLSHTHYVSILLFY